MLLLFTNGSDIGVATGGHIGDFSDVTKKEGTTLLLN